MVNHKRRKRVKGQRRVVLHFIEVLAQRGTRVTTDEIKTLMRRKNISEFISVANLIPWVKVHLDDHGYLFSVDSELREICEGLRPRPTLPAGFSVAEFFATLSSEITARRNANQDYRDSRRWNPDPIVKQQQSALLDWIQHELDRVAALYTNRLAS